MRPSRIHNRPLRIDTSRNTSITNKRKNKQKYENDNAALIIAVMMFIGVFTIIFFSTRTVTSLLNISRIFAAVAVVLSIIPRRLFPKEFRERKYLKVLLVVAALSPTVTGLIFATNYFINTERSTEQYVVIRMHLWDNSTILEVELENHIFEDHVNIRRFDIDKYPTMPKAAIFDIGNGIFGMKVIHKKELVFELEYD